VGGAIENTGLELHRNCTTLHHDCTTNCTTHKTNENNYLLQNGAVEQLFQKCAPRARVCLSKGFKQAYFPCFASRSREQRC